jgi:hypothetical protein
MCGGGIDCVDFFDGPPDSSLLNAHEIDDYLQHSFLPWARRNDEFVIAVADTSNANLSWLAARYGGHLRLVPVEATMITAAIENVFREQLTHDAVYGLADAEPHLCARETITRKQIVIFSALATTIIVAAAAWPAIASAGLAIVLTVGYLANIMFRTSLVWVGAKETVEHAPSFTPRMPDVSLPRYTVMVPLYREANVLPSLIEALRALDYPQQQLDIKIVVEADDAETFAAARALDLRAPFEIIRVPDHRPRTKPAACNYALRLARGEFTVIFDAEDRPEPDQLRKAVAAFRASPPEVGCLQARLNFYNANENWLTRGMLALTPQENRLACA